MSIDNMYDDYVHRVRQYALARDHMTESERQQYLQSARQVLDNIYNKSFDVYAPVAPMSSLQQELSLFIGGLPITIADYVRAVMYTGDDGYTQRVEAYTNARFDGYETRFVLLSELMQYMCDTDSQDTEEALSVYHTWEWVLLGLKLGAVLDRLRKERTAIAQDQLGDLTP